MNPIRDIAERMLEDPPPPLPAPDQMLAGARRYARRRDTATAAAGGLAVLLVAGTVALVAGPAPRTGPPIGAPTVPVARAAAEHGRWMTRLILAAVPARFHKASEALYDDSTVVQPTAPVEHVMVLATSVIRVSEGEREGQVVAYLTADGHPPPAADLCALGVTARAPGECTTVVVDGVPVRIVRTNGVITGTRFLAGGQLAVAAWQDAHHGGAPLTTSPLTVEQLAALTANPEMLQFS